MHSCRFVPSDWRNSVTMVVFPLVDLPLDFPPPFPLLLPPLGCHVEEEDGFDMGFVALGRSWRRTARSDLTYVISWMALSKLQLRSLTSSAIVPQIWRSAACASRTVAVRSPVSAETFWVKSEMNFWEYSLSVARWAPLHRAMAALKRSMEVLMAFMPMLSLLTSIAGISSMRRELKDKPSNFGILAARWVWSSSHLATLSL